MKLFDSYKPLQQSSSGYVTFCTENYLPIITNLVTSILTFSKYPLHIFTLNFDLSVDHDRISSTRVNTAKEIDFYLICALKLYAAIHSPFRFTVMLDGDMIITENADELQDIYCARVANLNHPVFARHPHNSLTDHPRTESLRQVFSFFGASIEPIRYLYASFIFLEHQKWLFGEALEAMSKKRFFGEDEAIVNALIHKYKLHEADIGFNYLPNASLEILGHYIAGNENISHEIIETYLANDCPVKFYLFHGHLIKNSEITQEFLRSVAKKRR